MKSKIILLLLFTSMLQAQTLVWTKPVVDNVPIHNFLIATDYTGNTFITGWFSGTVDFDPGPATYTLYSPTASAFVAKKDPQGNFLWAVNLVGGSSNGRFNITTDNSGNVYAHGFFSGSCDFDPGSGIQTLSTNTAIPSQFYSNDQFIWKLSPTGNFIWAKHMAHNQFVYDLKADASGNLYMVGIFRNTCDFDPGIGVSNLTSFGTADGFISKFDPAGNLIDVKQVGGSGSFAFIKCLTIDAANNLFAAGTFSGGIDVDPGSGINTLNASSNQDFSFRLNSTGSFLSAIAYIYPMGTKPQDKLQDSFGNTYITGTFSGTCDFDTGISTYTMQATDGVFLYKLDPNGNFAWAKSINRTNTVSPNYFATIRSDGGSNIYFSSIYSGTMDIDPGAGILQINTGTMNVSSFVCVLNSNGDFISGLSTAPCDWAVHSNGEIYTLSTSSVSKFSSLFTGVNEIKTDRDYQLIVYPNPGNGEFNLRMPPITNNSALEIYNSLGQKIAEQTIDSEISSINLINYQNGIYLLRLSDKGVLVGQARLVKQ